MEREHDITDETLWEGYIPEAITQLLAKHYEFQRIGPITTHTLIAQAKRWKAFQEDRQKSLSQHMDHYAGPSK